MTPRITFGEDAKVQLEAVLELSRRLKGVSRKELKIAVKALNYPYRTDRIRVYTDSATTAFGSLVSGSLVVAYLWVGYQMVLRDHVNACVVLCGIPATSIASIFMLKRALGADILGAFARIPWNRNQQPAPQEPPAGPAQTTPTEAPTTDPAPQDSPALPAQAAPAEAPAMDPERDPAP